MLTEHTTHQPAVCWSRPPAAALAGERALTAEDQRRRDDRPKPEVCLLLVGSLRLLAPEVADLHPEIARLFKLAARANQDS